MTIKQDALRDAVVVRKGESAPASAGSVAYASYVSDHHVVVQVDGEVMNLFVARTDEGTWVWHRGRARLIAAEQGDARTRRKTGAKKPGAVTPPMPANVVRILVEVGDRVEVGQGLVVVTAMKMETTLGAPEAGIVKAINAHVGKNVKPGDILVDIEADPLP